MILMNYIVAFFLICLGFYTVVTKYNLVIPCCLRLPRPQ